MKEEFIQAMMHPIRIKIIQELSLKGQATTKDMMSVCDDCAQATLYRHLKALLKHQIIEVIDENIVNGITQKVYAINTSKIEGIASDPQKMSKADFLSLFSQYVMALLADMAAYFEQEDPFENIKNSIGFSSSSIYLSDDELQEMMKELHEIVMKRLNNTPSKDRVMRKISNVVTTMPASKKP
ncbi:MAG: helix-turn-helix domain-containing protein [Acholeplasmataceae bacterium]|nr:helix-turn-helix domain-containing protein [Acholeplasmataceae bacterium]